MMIGTIASLPLLSGEHNDLLIKLDVLSLAIFNMRELFKCTVNSLGAQCDRCNVIIPTC